MKGLLWVRVMGLVIAAAVLVGGCAAAPKAELSRAMRNESAAERREALAHLRKTARPEMAADIASILARDLSPTVRATAADVLRRLAQPESVPALMDAARHDAGWVVRKHALRALAAVADDPEQYLRDSLQQDPDLQVRVEAVTLARDHLGKAPATALLLEALQDKDAAVRTQACLSLRQLTGKSLPPEYDIWRQELGGEVRPHGTK